MKEAEKTICLVDTGRESQARIPSELYQTREVCVWILKHRAKEVSISKTLSHRRNVQQREVRVSSQRYETRVSTSEHEAYEVRISQLSPGKRYK